MVGGTSGNIDEIQPNRFIPADTQQLGSITTTIFPKRLHTRVMTHISLIGIIEGAFRNAIKQPSPSLPLHSVLAPTGLPGKRSF